MTTAEYLKAFFKKYAVCSCGEQEFNIKDGVCGWCGSDVPPRSEG